MEEICKNAPKNFCISLELVCCCDFYECESKLDENYYCYIRSNKFFTKHNSKTLNEIVNSESAIQLLHDISIQIRHLHIVGLSFTDVDENDILEVQGRFCIINTDKLIKFDKKTNYANLIHPILFGPFIANELSNINRIPANNAIHKNSVIWSIGKMIVHHLDSGNTVPHAVNSGESGNTVPHAVNIGNTVPHAVISGNTVPHAVNSGESRDSGVSGKCCKNNQLLKEESHIELLNKINEMDKSNITPILIRCLQLDPNERMLLIL
jgi:hypothetical protein